MCAGVCTITVEQDCAECIYEGVLKTAANSNADLDMAQKIQRGRLSMQEKRIWMTKNIRRDGRACLQKNLAKPIQWFYLTDCTHYVSLSNHCSAFAHVHSGVPQGSVLGSILITMYIMTLSAIIDSHSIIHHLFADDLQLQMSAPPDRISELLHSMQSCISDVKAWATANMPKLNDNKTELMHVTTKRTKHLHNLPTSFTIGNVQIPFKQSVKNLCFTLDYRLTMIVHVSNIARTCYFELRRLACICRFPTSTATATLVSAFVLS